MLRTLRIHAWVVTLAMLGCQSPPSATDEQPAAEAKPPADVEVPEGARDGPAAWFAIEARGVVRLDAAGATPMPALGEPLRDLFIGPDGRVYARTNAELLVAEAGAWTERVDLSEVAPVHALSLGKDGTPWVVTATGVGARVDGAWQLTPLAELELAPEVELGIDHEGTVWLVGADTVLYREGDAWLPAPIELLEPGTRLHHPTPSPVGAVHVNNAHRLTRLGKATFESYIIDFKRTRSYDAGVAIAPDGRACVATSECDLGCVNPIPPTKIWRMGASEYGCESFEAFAIDGQHRVWVAAREGLSVIEEDRTVHAWPVGRFPALAGHVTHLVVEGEGPALPDG